MIKDYCEQPSALTRKVESVTENPNEIRVRIHHGMKMKNLLFMQFDTSNAPLSGYTDTSYNIGDTVCHRTGSTYGH